MLQLTLRVAVFLVFFGQALADTHRECGGIISVATEGNTTIEYRGTNGESYDMNERCIWTLIPIPDSPIYSYLVYVEQQDFGTEGQDGLIVYTWTPTYSLTPKKILSTDTGSILTFNAQHAFIYFSSGNSTTNGGTGFKLTVIAVAGTGTTVETAQFHNSALCPTNILHPVFTSTTYKTKERRSFTLQAKLSDNPSTNLNLVYFRTYSSSTGYLFIYKLPPYTATTNFVLVEQLIGSQPSKQYPNIEDPILLLFTAGDYAGRGFHMTWT